MGSELLDAALAYARRGWHVFPLQPSGKRPLGALVPNGKDDASADEARIRAWWTTAPTANIGIALAPSRLLALDVDTNDGKQGKASLAEIVGELPSTTLTQASARGGRHFLFQAPAEVEPASRIDFKPGLDLIGAGYIVAAPSTFDGKPYRWLNDHAIAACPPYLAGVARTRPRKEVESVESGVTLTQGGRNNALFRLGAALRDTGLDERSIALALHSTNDLRCAPPLDDDEINRIASSVCRSVTPTRDVLLGAHLLSQLPAPVQAPGATLPSNAPDDVAGGGAPLARSIALRERPPIREYPSAFAQLNPLIGGGWLTRTLSVLSGPPAAGKTAFAVSVASHASTVLNLPVLYCCTELESEEITARIAAPILGVPWTKLERGRCEIRGQVLEGEALRVATAEALAALKIHVIGAEALRTGIDGIRQIAESTNAIALSYGVPPVVIVDYLQDLARGGDADGTKRMVGDLSMHLRAMAQALDCVVLVVSSVSRSWYGQAKADSMRNSGNAEIYLTAVKESGDVDYAAATVMFLDVAPPGDLAGRPARIAVAKARRGETGFAGARFHGASGAWADDPGALSAMTPEAVQSAKHEAKACDIEAKVIDVLQRLGPKRKTALIDLIDGKDAPIRAAINGMLLAQPARLVELAGVLHLPGRALPPE